jgi:hypothetical protein
MLAMATESGCVGKNHADVVKQCGFLNESSVDKRRLQDVICYFDGEPGDLVAVSEQNAFRLGVVFVVFIY